MKEPLLFPASLTIRSLCPLVLSQGAPSCAPAGGRAGLSESPGIWISPLAVGWDLSSFKHLLAFWGGCTCKCHGWLWMLLLHSQGTECGIIPLEYPCLSVPLNTPSPQSKKLQDPFIYQQFQCILPTSFSPHPSLLLNVPGFSMQS